jgi:hypothetical protein
MEGHGGIRAQAQKCRAQKRDPNQRAFRGQQQDRSLWKINVEKPNHVDQHPFF